MRRLILIAASIGLAACDKAPSTDPNAKAAGGEVLPGTVSDAMLDLDGSTAEAPLAPRASGKPGSDKSDKDAVKPAAKASAPAEDSAEKAAPAEAEE